jgi:hypothetical protein
MGGERTVLGWPSDDAFAPIPAVRGTTIEPQASTLSGHPPALAGTHTALILHRNRPFPGPRPKGLGHQRQLLLGGVTRPVILPTSPSSDDAWPSLNA